MASPNVFQFLEHSAKHGISNTLNALEDRRLDNLLTEMQARALEEETNDRIANRDMNARKLAAEVEQAELTNDLSSKYLERQMLGVTQTHEREAAKAQLELEQAQKYGMQNAANAARQAQYSADKAREDLLAAPGERAKTEAMTALYQQQAEQARAQEAAFNQAKTVEEKKENERQFIRKQTVIYQTLTSFPDLKDPKQASAAASIIKNTPGITVTGQDIQDIIQFPEQSLALAKIYAITPAQREQARLEQIKTSNKLTEIQFQSQMDREEAEYRANLDSRKPKELKPLPSTYAKRAADNFTLDLTQQIFGDESILIKESSSYDPDIAVQMKAISRRIVGQAEQLSQGNIEDFNHNLEEAKKEIVNTYHASLVLNNNDVKVAWDRTPKDTKTLDKLQVGLDRATLEPNSKEGRVMKTFMQREDLPNYISSMKSYGINEGVDPEVVDYLLGMAVLYHQQKKPREDQPNG